MPFCSGFKTFQSVFDNLANTAANGESVQQNIAGSHIYPMEAIYSQRIGQYNPSSNVHQKSEHRSDEGK